MLDIKIIFGITIYIWVNAHYSAEGKTDGDSYGNSTSPKTPQRAVFALEEAEAVPVESEVRFFRSGG